MSIQLAIYPQNKEGYNFTSTPIQNEHVSDNSTYNSATQDLSFGSIDSDPMDEAINNDPANSNWKLMNTELGGGWIQVKPPAISIFSGKVGIKYESTGSGNNTSGVYQEIQNLIPLKYYTLEWDVINSLLGSGFIELGVDGRSDTLGGGDFTTFSTNFGSYSHTFQAQQLNEILAL